MADFQKAFLKTMGAEGGYSNDPDDRGGETYRGIARKFHPDWPGWKIIDALKSYLSDLRRWTPTAEMNNLVEEFYKEKFWDVFRGDSIQDQPIAEEIFDSGVNFGSSTEGKILQRAINVACGTTLTVDGKVGPATIAALNDADQRGRDSILWAMNTLQGMRYIEDVEDNPSQRKYLRGGWKERARS
ncbi:MAG: hypothetical protein HQM00_17585 [Magnetococcales bacterium]|nr:hypothetical protein [Magnetococcales bacterium]